MTPSGVVQILGAAAPAEFDRAANGTVEKSGIWLMTCSIPGLSA